MNDSTYFFFFKESRKNEWMNLIFSSFLKSTKNQRVYFEIVCLKIKVHISTQIFKITYWRHKSFILYDWGRRKFKIDLDSCWNNTVEDFLKPQNETICWLTVPIAEIFHSRKPISSLTNSGFSGRPNAQCISKYQKKYNFNLILEWRQFCEKETFLKKRVALILNIKKIIVCPISNTSHCEMLWFLFLSICRSWKKGKIFLLCILCISMLFFLKAKLSNTYIHTYIEVQKKAWIHWFWLYSDYIFILL